MPVGRDTFRMVATQNNMLEHGPPTSLVATNNSILPKTNFEKPPFLPLFFHSFSRSLVLRGPPTDLVRAVVWVLSQSIPVAWSSPCSCQGFSAMQALGQQSRVARRVRAYLTKTKLLSRCPHLFALYFFLWPALLHCTL